MHPSLATFPSSAFYGGRVHSGVSEEARPALRGFDWPSPRASAALVLSTSPEDGSAGRSKCNRGEAATVLSILRGLMMAGELRAAQIGVVTPYTAQVSLIRNELQARGRGVLMISASSASAVSNGGHLFWNLQALAGGRAIEVKTVDGFQGREKELIIFSAVRAGRSGSLGFVSDARRLNVAFTRARRGLIVVGEPRTLVWSGGHSH